ncbi:5-bromo-4-chloroindolyl phosphate hydrolysis family protein [Facklamia sp. DSM 111018]|uniref:5-bromo-4-chloroindolyl phosphate hydrolysis family protein n=2 Tax=Facklamia lactis TaxID=2749967 RepID=A0ABS0LNC2_9LACT|nr:5-bromo-4-chloroindolyl phosphate hydrolysis family protein [Facklamia lactis]MBG9985668.1 5-bromo-4-chloroindolyl phosphate hydrolysis family protein [Facklamia lactis]
MGAFIIKALIQFYQFAKQSTSFLEIFSPQINKPVGIVLLMLVAALFTQGLFLPPYTASLCRGALPVIVGTYFLSSIFYFIRKQSERSWIWLFYYLGLFFIITLSMVATLEDPTYHHYWNNLAHMFSMTYAISGAVIVCSTIVGALALISKRGQHPAPSFSIAHYKQKPKRNLMAHYQEAGLSKHEIESFRQQMAISRDHINRIDHNFQLTAKMRAIEIRHNVVKVSQNYFKDIVEEPQRQLAASNFLLTLLPQLDDLLEKYNEINAHVAKNKQTYLILEKSAQTIDQISQEIVEDYIAFHEEAYQELEDGLKLADRTLKRGDQSNSEEETTWTKTTPASSLMSDYFDDDPFDAIDAQINQEDSKGE